MNPINRSNEILAAARVRSPGACLPGSATSPADRLGTVTVAHELIAAWDRAARAEAAERDVAAGRAVDREAGDRGEQTA